MCGPTLKETKKKYTNTELEESCDYSHHFMVGRLRLFGHTEFKDNNDWVN